MYKQLLSLALLIASAIGLQAQNLDETPVVSPSDTNDIHVAPILKNTKTNDKLNYSFSVGTSFITAKNFGSGMASYVAPEVTYKLSPRVKINAGVMFINSNFALRPRYFTNEQSVVIKTKPTNSAIAYVEGDYLVNSRLSISAMIMRDVAGNQTGFSNVNSPVQSMSVNMNYKITDNITIGAGMHINQGVDYGYPYSNYNFAPANNFNPLLGF
jgi:hypothetical protein